ncbi:hypothetical protein E2C01_033692 [Portunus trituberculatus]|uniref:Uncharacterized protein n=1 Tax=Portunus trituberculatus TaxID=210409 RepID=A0A5B7F3L3_PORTR|nr:hypothetical protein [Portunus trituberculatus]
MRSSTEGANLIFPSVLEHSTVPFTHLRLPPTLHLDSLSAPPLTHLAPLPVPPLLPPMLYSPQQDPQRTALQHEWRGRVETRRCSIKALSTPPPLSVSSEG